MQSLIRSPLLALPAELRAHIWKTTLGGGIFEVYCWPSRSRQRAATRVLNPQRNFAALLRTCQQIYSEARLIPLKHNAFQINSEDALQLCFDLFEPWARCAIVEVHLVTWRATCMIEGVSIIPRQIAELVNVRDLCGLHKVYVEVRWGSSLGNPVSLDKAEERLRQSIMCQSKQVEVDFRRSSSSAFPAVQLI
jgi:hypothetical protein